MHRLPPAFNVFTKHLHRFSYLCFWPKVVFFSSPTRVFSPRTLFSVSSSSVKLYWLANCKLISYWKSMFGQFTVRTTIFHFSTGFLLSFPLIVLCIVCRWSKWSGCSGHRVADRGQPAPSSSVPAPGHPWRPCGQASEASWRPTCVVGVSVCQVPEPPSGLAVEGDARGHHQAGLQAPHHRVRHSTSKHQSRCYCTCFTVFY